MTSSRCPGSASTFDRLDPSRRIETVVAPCALLSLTICLDEECAASVLCLSRRRAICSSALLKQQVSRNLNWHSAPPTAFRGCTTARAIQRMPRNPELALIYYWITRNSVPALHEGFRKRLRSADRSSRSSLWVRDTVNATLCSRNILQLKLRHYSNL